MWFRTGIRKNVHDELVWKMDAPVWEQWIENVSSGSTNVPFPERVLLYNLSILQNDSVQFLFYFLCGIFVGNRCTY